MDNWRVLTVFGILIASSASLQAGEIPPVGSKPLSAILKTVEGKNLGKISEAQFDDGLWEVKVCKSSGCEKLYINPKSGAQQRRRKTSSDETPPAKAKPLSEIIKTVEKRGQGKITEVDLEHGVWEVEIKKDGRTTRLHIDPVTGKTRT